MRFLLSALGSRGEIQPLAALACALRDLGQEVRLCAPPDFRDWIEGLGFPVVPVGPELRPTAAPAPRAQAAAPTPEQRRRMLAALVAGQAGPIGEAARGCDVLLAGGALQIATRSIAERLGVPYVYAAFCARTLPSPHHAPIPIWGAAPPEGAGPRALWAADALHWNDAVGPALAAHREAAGLPPVTEVRDHLFTDSPWLASDAALDPWPEPSEQRVVRTGAWILPDDGPLPPEVAAFLDAGEPPVCFGFGSIRTPPGLADAMVAAARALGRRAILLRGWAGLAAPGDAPDLLSVGEVNQQALFTRVAAVVHHGGAGTTTAAARAGAPQVVIPQIYDQPHWAGRVRDLGLGAAHAPGAPTADSLTAALAAALEPDVAARARAFAASVRTDGAATAAHLLLLEKATNA